MNTRLVDLDAAVDLVSDGATIYVGGAVLRRKPMAFLRALVTRGRQGLHAVTFAGSLDIEILLAAGAVDRLTTAYVGLGHAGFAPRFRAAAEEGTVDDREHSEWTMLGQLRAAAMGLPFLPTRAGQGSDIVAALDLRSVDDPYGGGSYHALPPLAPDVTVLHAWRATPAGDIQMVWPPEHLWDVDVVAARAARKVVVTVDEVVPPEVAAQDAHLTRLYNFEVDAVVHVPGGSWPTASPPATDEDHDVIAAYAASGDVSLLDPERRA
jgi:glutaconate CoA-transferase, subunit A